MGSLYKELDLFGSGPHRFQMGRQGRRMVSLAAVTNNASVPGTDAFGDLELRVEVRGRLVAEDEADLWELRDAIVNEARDDSPSGQLEDQHGQQWETMKLLTYSEDGAISRGRTWSVGYIVEFGRLYGE